MWENGSIGGVNDEAEMGWGSSVQPGGGRGRPGDVVPVAVEGVRTRQGQAGETTPGYTPQTTWEERKESRGIQQTIFESMSASSRTQHRHSKPQKLMETTDLSNKTIDPFVFPVLLCIDYKCLPITKTNPLR